MDESATTPILESVATLITSSAVRTRVRRKVVEALRGCSMLGYVLGMYECMDVCARVGASGLWIVDCVNKTEESKHQTALAFLFWRRMWMANGLSRNLKGWCMRRCKSQGNGVCEFGDQRTELNVSM